MSPLWPEGAPINVECVGERPVRLYWEGRYHQVERVSRHWRVDLDWWAPAELWRDYWELATDTSLLCVLYCDLVAGGWRLERIYP